MGAFTNTHIYFFNEIVHLSFKNILGKKENKLTPRTRRLHDGCLWSPYLLKGTSAEIFLNAYMHKLVGFQPIGGTSFAVGSG